MHTVIRSKDEEWFQNDRKWPLKPVAVYQNHCLYEKAISWDLFDLLGVYLLSSRSL
jgi:hypothetical protein